MAFFRPYVPVAVRRKRAAQTARRMARKGRKLDPVVLDAPGRKIAQTFWGKAWCDNLERYADFSNRLPRGRTYVRNGSVMDLRIERGTVSALVMGSELYEIAVSVRALSPERWRRAISACSGQIDSLVELLSGRLSEGVMRVVTDPNTGLFPAPREIETRCSCLDWAGLCKHRAATLYGVGARLDERPELLFVLRGVDPGELVDRAARSTARISSGRSGRVTVADDALADIFGIELDREPAASMPTPTPKSKPRSGPNTPRPKRPRKPSSVDWETEVLARVRSNPGERVEQLARALGTTTRELMQPVKRLILAGSLTTRGQKRGTRYYLAGARKRKAR